MSNTTKAIWAFWIFIIGMMIWEAYSYNANLTKEAEERAKNPDNGHYFFYQKDPRAKVKPEAVTHEGTAFVLQTGTKIEPGEPSSIYFTFDVTLKNTGTVKATFVQVRVRPYRGIIVGDPDFAPTNKAIAPIDDSDPAAQIDEWISFPDIAPGESVTRGTSFMNKPGYTPGKNPNPEIHFTTAKK